MKKKLSHIIKPERTIGLLLDVKEIQMMDIHRESEFSYQRKREGFYGDEFKWGRS